MKFMNNSPLLIYICFFYNFLSVLLFFFIPKGRIIPLACLSSWGFDFMRATRNDMFHGILGLISFYHEISGMVNKVCLVLFYFGLFRAGWNLSFTFRSLHLLLQSLIISNPNTFIALYDPR